MPSNKQRRQAAQRHLQRQLERRAELARKRRRNLLITVTVAAVVLVAGAVWLVTGLGGDDDDPTVAADSSSSPAAAAESPVAPVVNPDGTVTCDFAPDGSGTDVGIPADEAATPATGTSTLAVTTSAGDMTFTLDRAKAPCAASSFTHLASVGFFDGSPCHREVNQPTFGVLQCGDPTGTGQGGPGYRFYEEVTPETTYPRGTIAMANSGAPGSTGSQFFLCFTDTQLPPDYTAVGTVDEAGLAVLDQIAAAGNDGSFEPSPGGGAPNTPVTITSVTVVQ
ncbi:MULTISPECIES: peptidylprolyl isomerase [unclassified Blastococcus]